MINRPIKFRCWDTKNKRFLKGIPPEEYMLDSDCWSHHDLDEAYMIYPDSPFDLFTNRLIYSQYLGKKDRDGIEIWENDIVEYSEGVELGEWTTYRGVVKYDETFAAFGLAMNLNSDCSNYFIDSIRGIKVLGNIFQNPELLKID